MMKLLQDNMRAWTGALGMIGMIGMLCASAAQAQTATPADLSALAAPPATRAAPAQRDAYLPPALRRPLRDASPGPILLRYQAMQKLHQRFDSADTDGSGTLSRDEARKAGLGFIDKNFDHIDSAQRGAVNFDDLKAWLIQRREEANSR